MGGGGGGGCQMIYFVCFYDERQFHYEAKRKRVGRNILLLEVIHEDSGAANVWHTAFDRTNKRR